MLIVAPKVMETTNTPLAAGHPKVGLFWSPTERRGSYFNSTIAFHPEQQSERTFPEHLEDRPVVITLEEERKPLISLRRSIPALIEMVLRLGLLVHRRNLIHEPPNAAHWRGSGFVEDLWRKNKRLTTVCS